MANRSFEHRREAQYRRLGTRTACCVICGEANPDCLELHHVAGRAYDDDTVILCRNCHRTQSEGQYHDPDIQDGDDPQLFASGRYMLGLARLFEAMAPHLAARGANLIDQARRQGSSNV